MNPLVDRKFLRGERNVWDDAYPAMENVLISCHYVGQSFLDNLLKKLFY